jgi:hypothetical protein
MSDSLYPDDLFGASTAPASTGTLKEKFKGTAPFSVLDARAGDWQERKRAWLALGIKSEVGRAENLLKFSDAILKAQAGVDPYAGRRENWNEEYEGGDAWAGAGTSIFDPRLCELLYDWFCPPGGQIIDPFAGGSVRGVVASVKGFRYWGSDLRDEQIAANRAQGEALCKPPAPMPVWVQGDSRDTLDELPAHGADFLFSCPPYGDLEVYSDDPRDLSNMEWRQFVPSYQEIIQKAVTRLGHCRFAAFVVGNIRDKKGAYRGLPAETVRAFALAGMVHYGELILVTSVGSAALRAGKMFESSRKVCPCHQYVLVFVKGDPEQAAARCRGEAASKYGRIGS